MAVGERMVIDRIVKLRKFKKLPSTLQAEFVFNASLNGVHIAQKELLKKLKTNTKKKMNDAIVGIYANQRTGEIDIELRDIIEKGG